MQQPLTDKPPRPTSPSASAMNTSSSSNEFYGLRNATSSSTLSNSNLFRMVHVGHYWLIEATKRDVLLRPTSTHLIVIFVILLALGLKDVNLLQPRANTILPLKQIIDTRLEVPSPQEEGELLTLPTNLNNFINGVLSRAAVPRTTTLQTTEGNLPAVAAETISTYVVEPGDTIFGIAANFGLAPETILWSNPDFENNPDLLQVGQELMILPVDGVYHQVGSSDTIEGIAATFRADPAALIDHPLNGLDPDNLTLQPGQWVIVPGGTKPFVPRTVTAYTGPVPEDATSGTGSFSWPASGPIYQGYWSAHPGLDIAAWLGAPVSAADSGYVIAAGWDNTGFGYNVVIDHGNGFQTLYAHLQAYYVDVGDNVVQGAQIGEMGTSGNSTGPHLHFEVRQGTVQRNPNGFLP